MTTELTATSSEDDTMGTLNVRRRRKAQLGAWSNGMRMSPEEFDERTDFDELYAYELINGVLIVSPPPGESERDPNDELAFLFRAYQWSQPGQSALDKTLSEQYIHLPGSRRRADRVIWVGLGRIPDPMTDVPAIVIEFVSRRLRDRLRDYVEKRGEYLAVGVQEYWIIDRFRRIMTVYRQPTVEPAELIVKESEVYRTPLLPGFELPLSRLLKVADDWNRGTTKTRSGKNQGKAEPGNTAPGEQV